MAAKSTMTDIPFVGDITRFFEDEAPKAVRRAIDKARARIAAIQTVLGAVDYAGRDLAAIGTPDPKIAGGPEILNA